MLDGLHDDVHNRALVARVHPPDWVNPEPAKRYNLVVVGGGSAGLISALGAAGLGARVALVEKHLLGGDCLNFGCVPSKALLSSAARAQAGGWAGPEAFGPTMERLRRLRAQIGEHDSAERMRDAGIDVFLGAGRFTGKDTLLVGEQTLRFKKAVIATGARAAVPPIPGLADTDYLTNERLFELTELPRRLHIIGAGAIGCEMAQAFARLGSKVSLIEMADRVLPIEDPEASAIVGQRLADEGVELLHGAQVVRVEPGRLVLGDGREPEWDALLVATGRAPNVEGLGLKEAGVAYDGRGGVVVDDHLRTTNRRIFAAGDVASRYKFTHAADAMARIVIRNALFGGRAKVSDLVMPWCTFTTPEVAHVGMTSSEAEAAGASVLTYTATLDHVDRAIVDDGTAGYARVHVEARSGRLLGASLVAAHAGEAIGEMSLAITSKLSIDAVGNAIHPYPTVAEVWRRLAGEHMRTKLKPWVARLFAAFFRWSRGKD